MPGLIFSYRMVIVTVLLIAICLSGAWRWRRSAMSHSVPGTVRLAEVGQPITIVARGHEFSWRFLSAGADRIFETKDDLLWNRQLVLPPHTPVDFLLRSDDYIYTFSLAGLKGIAIQGIESAVHFQTPDTGSFTLEVDPLCGYRPYHDDIMGTISIDPALRPGEIRKGDRVAATE